MTNGRQAVVSPGAAPENRATPVGQWPDPTPRWGLAVSALLWAGWLGFLIWMMIVRLQSGA